MLLDLHPLAVMSHFLLALLVVAGAVVVALEAWSHTRWPRPPAGPPWLRAVAAVGVAACAALVVTGTVATASGPHSGGQDIRRLGLGVTDTVYVHVRATAVFGIGLLVVGRLSLAPATGAARHRSCGRGAARRAPGPDDRRRGPVPKRVAVVARRHPRLARGDDLDADRRDRLFACTVLPAPLVSSGPVVRIRRWRASSRSTSSPTLRRPVLIAAFRGWNDGGQAATLAAGTLAAGLGCEAVRGDRPRRIRRLPGNAPAGLARRGDDAPHRVARDRVSRGRDPRCRPGRRDPARRRAELPLATVQRVGRRAGRASSASSSSSRSARCSPTCRTRGPHP